MKSTVANCKSKANLRKNIGPRRQRKRRKQASRGLLLSESLLFSVFNLTKTTGNSKLGQMIVNYAIDFVPKAFTKTKNRSKKKGRKADTGIGNYNLISKDFN